MTTATKDRASDPDFLKACALDKELHDAIRSGPLQRLIDCLDKGADPNARLLQDDGGHITPLNWNKEGNFPIHLASVRGVDHLRVLLDRGANANARNALDYTPIQTCLLSLPFQAIGIEAIELLMERGADVNARNHQQETAAHTLVLISKFPRFSGLFALFHHAGLRLDLLNHQNMSPLDIAIQKNDTTTALMFLAHGARDSGKLTWMHSAGISMIRAAAITGCTDRLRVLYDPADPDNGLDELERLARGHGHHECAAVIQSMKAMEAIASIEELNDHFTSHPTPT